MGQQICAADLSSGTRSALQIFRTADLLRRSALLVLRAADLRSRSEGQQSSAEQSRAAELMMAGFLWWIKQWLM
jgi:hypothetical protein